MTEEQEDRYGYFIHWSTKSSAEIAREQAKGEQLPRWQQWALKKAYKDARRTERARADKWK